MVDIKTNYVKSEIIGVDCVPIEEDNKDREEMIKYVEATINELSVPLVRIYTYGETTVRENTLFDKKSIFDTIAKSAHTLVDEKHNMEK